MAGCGERHSLTSWDRREDWKDCELSHVPDVALVCCGWKRFHQLEQDPRPRRGEEFILHSQNTTGRVGRGARVVLLCNSLTSGMSPAQEVWVEAMDW